MRIGLIGIVGEEAKADFWGTMARVAEIGYQGVEAVDGALVEGDVAANLARFQGLGLQHLTTSASIDDLQNDLDGIVARTKATGADRVSVWWSNANDRDILLSEAEIYNVAGAKLAAEGLRLCYHNHEHEFRYVVDGENALDILANNTDPANLYFTIDVGWVTMGGADPAAVLHRLAGRVPTIHVKDFYDINERNSFTALGTGIVDFNSALSAAKETGVEWAVVEQDRLRYLSAWDTVVTSYLNLKERGL
jgi:sugar phosphate isomerase/epimerase